MWLRAEFLSRMIPKTWIDLRGTIVDEDKVRGQVVSCFVQAIVKCARI